MNTRRYFLVPLLGIILLAPWLSSIDLYIAHTLFTLGAKGFSQNPFVLFIDTWGHIPAIALCSLAAILWLLSFTSLRAKPYRRAALYVGLCLVISFIITYGIGKHTFKRPRPKELEVFGGKKPFSPFYLQSHAGGGKSFPSGHANTGCYFFVLFFVGRRYRRKQLSRFGIIAGMLFGITLSICRLLQGAHFFSDVLFGGAIMWFIACILDKILLKEHPLEGSAA